MGAGVRLSLWHPKAPVKDALRAGRDILFDIDWQGTQQSQAAMGEDLVTIFILPPSMPELERRLRTRGTDSEDVIADRMARAAERNQPLARIRLCADQPRHRRMPRRRAGDRRGRAAQARAPGRLGRLRPRPGRPTALGVEQLQEPAAARKSRRRFSSAAAASGSAPHCSSCQRSSTLTASEPLRA